MKNGRHIVHWCWLVPLTLCVFVLSTSYPCKAQERSRVDRWSKILPAYIKGFETDAPLIISERFQQQEYFSVSRIYYKTDGSETVEIAIKDYSVNPDTYSQQLKNLRQVVQEGGSENTGRYHGYLMQKQANKHTIERAIYLGSNLVVKVEHKGDISNPELIDQLLKRMELKEVKQIVLSK